MRLTFTNMAELGCLGGADHKGSIAQSPRPPSMYMSLLLAGTISP